MDKEVSEPKEQRIRKIAISYYSRKDVLDAIYKFSDKREISPRYFEGFGKRPDSLQYPSDVLSLVKKGATSFHCSEELWTDPLELSTGFSEEQLNEIREGWDVIIDIDCKWIYYSKKAAQAIIKVLKSYGVENIGIKFSGNKGFHIIIPWGAFPEYVDEIKTSDMFPEWPKAIVNYLKEKSHPILTELIKDTETDFKKVKGFMGIKCESCNNLASRNFEITLRCPNCYRPPHIETFKSFSKDYKKRKCPNCSFMLEQKNYREFYVCNNCELNSLEDPTNFNERIESVNIFEVLGLDVLLVSSRHLFRMPYSLHEKTALASIVLDKNKIENFELTDANPLNVKVKDFSPTPRKDEAKKLLFHSVDWQKTQESKKEDKKLDYSKTDQYKGKKFEKINIKNLKDEYFPPAIIKILKGMNDGKKRALFILMNFFRSLGISMEDIEKRLNAWNKLNDPPLKQGYINAQLLWHSKNKPVLPPNFNNEIYKAIGVYELDNLSTKVKNPVNYVVRKSGAWKKKRNK